MKKLLSVIFCFSLLLNAMEERDIILFNVVKTDSGGLKLSMPDNAYKPLCKDETIKTYKKKLLAHDQALLSNEFIVRGVYAAPASLEIFKKVVDYNPGILFSECSSEYCMLNRAKYPFIRSLFHKKIMKRIEERFAKTKPLILTSFAAGTMLPELILLTDLMERGYALKVNLIDNAFGALLKVAPELPQGNVPEVIISQNLDKENCDLASKSAYQLAALQYWCTLQKKDAVDFTVYSNIDHYFADCLDYADKLSDCVVGLDYIGDLSPQGPADFMMLVNGCLKQGGLSCSLVEYPMAWLEKKNPVDGVIVQKMVGYPYSHGQLMQARIQQKKEPTFFMKVYDENQNDLKNLFKDTSLEEEEELKELLEKFCKDFYPIMDNRKEELKEEEGQKQLFIDLERMTFKDFEREGNPSIINTLTSIVGKAMGYIKTTR